MVSGTLPFGRVVFRVDAGTEIGTGHVMRCLTLADGLREQGAEVHFVCRSHEGHLGTFIEARGYAVHLLARCPELLAAIGNEPYGSWLGATVKRDAEDTEGVLAKLRPDWLVIDHYGIDARWQTMVRGSTGKIFVIDDLANRSHDCDVLMDQNVLRNGVSRYAGLVPSGCKLLLGPRYSLLRPEFIQARNIGLSERSEIKRVSIFFGGSDQHDLTSSVLDVLEKVDDLDLQIDVIVGATNRRAADIETRCKRNARTRFFMQVDNMAKLMSRADLAFGAAGGASWERCCLGLPAILINFAENQIELASELTRKRVSLNLGINTAVKIGAIEKMLRKLIARPSLVRRLSKRAARLVDGRGADRVSLIFNFRVVDLRPASEDDAEKVWAWRNAPTTREFFFDATAVSLEDHRAWWRKSIGAGDRILLLGRIGTLDLGVLRFDVCGAKAIISIYIDPELTGLGLGTALMNKGLDWIRWNRSDIWTLEAQVKTDNYASRRMFISTGFKEEYASFSWSREQSID